MRNFFTLAQTMSDILTLDMFCIDIKEVIT